MEGPLAAVLCSAILGTFATVLVAIIKFASRQDSELTTRVAVLENQHENLVELIRELKRAVEGIDATLKGMDQTNPERPR